MDIQYIADRIAIDDLLTRYATAVDAEDWALYRSCFTPDAFIDYTSAGGIKGTLDEVVAWLAQVMPIFSMTQHLVTNREVVVEGDTARARSAFYNPLALSDGNGGTTLYFDGGYYNDKLVRTADGWRIAERIEDSAYSTRLDKIGGTPEGGWGA